MCKISAINKKGGRIPLVRTSLLTTPSPRWTPPNTPGNALCLPGLEPGSPLMQAKEELIVTRIRNH
jgi:hypothetical protein